MRRHPDVVLMDVIVWRNAVLMGREGVSMLEPSVAVLVLSANPDLLPKLRQTLRKRPDLCVIGVLMLVPVFVALQDFEHLL